MVSKGGAVADHYAQQELTARLLAALEEAGHDIEQLDPDALAGADEFHLGGRAATDAFIESLELSAETRVLDVGCGIGGPARRMARVSGCHVSGVDVTAASVETATALSETVGLAEQNDFGVANALALPFADETFDTVTLIHVGMNVEDKQALARELARVTRRGGIVGIYDIMLRSDGELTYPVPWASAADTSFLAESREYADAVGAAGLSVERIEDRTQMVVEAVEKARATPPKIHLGHLMGPRWPEMFGNLWGALQASIVSPIELIARRAR